MFFLRRRVSACAAVRRELPLALPLAASARLNSRAGAGNRRVLRRAHRELRVRGHLERHHRVARRRERDALAPSPPRVARNRVGPEVALPGHELKVVGGEGVVAAVRAHEARGVVDGALRRGGCERKQAGRSVGARPTAGVQHAPAR